MAQAPFQICHCFVATYGLLQLTASDNCRISVAKRFSDIHFYIDVSQLMQNKLRKHLTQIMRELVRNSQHGHYIEICEW